MRGSSSSKCFATSARKEKEASRGSPPLEMTDRRRLWRRKAVEEMLPSFEPFFELVDERIEGG